MFNDEYERTVVLIKLIDQVRNRNTEKSRDIYLQFYVYFLQKLARVPFDYNFFKSQCAPHSNDLVTDLGLMHARWFLEYDTDASLLPTRSGRELGEKFVKLAVSYDTQLDFVIENLIDKTRGELEPLATALCVTSQSRDLNQYQRVNKVKELVPIFSLEEAQDAVQSVDRLIEEASRKEIIINDGLLEEGKDGPRYSPHLNFANS
jgi:hypothetical protein